MSELILGKDEEIVWSGYKKIFKINNPFTKYTLTTKALYIENGVLRYSCNEIRLFRICDMTITKTLMERICKTGSLKILSTDKSSPTLYVGSVSDVGTLKRFLSEYVEIERRKQGIKMGEFIR